MSLQLVLLLPKHLQWWLRIRRRIGLVSLSLTTDTYMPVFTHPPFFPDTDRRQSVCKTSGHCSACTPLSDDFVADLRAIIFCPYLQLLYCILTSSGYAASYPQSNTLCLSKASRYYSVIMLQGTTLKIILCVYPSFQILLCNYASRYHSENNTLCLSRLPVTTL